MVMAAVVVVVVFVASLSPTVASVVGEDVVVVSADSVPLLDLTYTTNVDVPASHQVRVVESDQQQINVKIVMNDMCGEQLLGTHVDAPSHFSNASWTVEDIPLYRLWNVPAVVLDVESAVRKSGNRTYAITAMDLEMAVSERHEFLPDGGVVLLHTGWDEKNHSLQDYLGYDGNGTNHFPGLREDGAEWLANYGYRRLPREGVVGVGIDTASVDVGDSRDNPARTVLHANNMYSIHNLKNLGKLPSSGFRVTVMPLKIGGGSAAPARVFATEDFLSGDDRRSSHHHSPPPSPSGEGSSEEDDYSGGIIGFTHGGWPYDKRRDYHGEVFYISKDDRVMTMSSATATSFQPLLLTAAATAMWLVSVSWI